MGVFNYNMKNTSDENFINKICNKFNLNTRLPKYISTTDLNTQIDIVLSTNCFIRAGVYETYFSYHKPIYVTLNEENMKFSSLNKDELDNNRINDTPKSIYEEEKKITWNISCDFLNQNQFIPQMIEIILVEINNLNITNNVRIMLQTIFYRHEDLLNMLNTYLSTCELGYFNGHTIDNQRNLKLYSTMQERAVVVSTKGDGSCLFRSASLCLFGIEEMHKAIRVMCCFIFNEHWLYFEHSDQMNYLFEYESIAKLIHDTANKHIWGGGAHLKAISMASKCTIYIYQTIDFNDKFKDINFEELQRRCGNGTLNKMHLLFKPTLHDDEDNSLIISKSIAMVYTDPGTNFAHYFAVLPKNKEVTLLKPKFRGDKSHSK